MSVGQDPMSREIDPYRIPKARWEVAPVAGLAAIDINANGARLERS